MKRIVLVLVLLVAICSCTKKQNIEGYKYLCIGEACWLKFPNGLIYPCVFSSKEDIYNFLYFFNGTECSFDILNNDEFFDWQNCNSIAYNQVEIDQELEKWKGKISALKILLSTPKRKRDVEWREKLDNLFTGA